MVVTLVVAILLVAAPSVLRVASAGFTRGNGYWLAAGSGSVFAFGDASIYASADGRSIKGLIIGMGARPTGKGYWLAARDGAVYPFGDAAALGDANKAGFKGQLAGIAITPSGEGYWLVGSQGEVLVFGDATSHGSLAASGSQPVVDITATPSGGGYWLLSASGAVYAFGDATDFGSAAKSGGKFVAMAATPKGDGYWITNDKGAVSVFGAATSFGSLAVSGPPVVDIAATVSGNGYWLAQNDGTVTAFGDAVYYGGLGRPDLHGAPVVAIVTTPFVNHPPVAAPDTASLDEDTFVDVNVLANDTDLDGDSLTASVETQPAHGTATLNADGTIRYTPAPNYNGSDSFTYRVTDSFGAFGIGTVTLTIRPVNDAPVATDDTYTTDEDVRLDVAAPGVLGNDSDVDGDTLSVVIVVGPAHGALDMTGGAFSYQPAADFNGTDSFTYRASDGVLTSGIATVSLQINPVPDPPRPQPDEYFVDEDDSLVVAAPGVLGNDSDPDGDSVTVASNTAPAHGTLELLADGSFVYTPDHDFNGTDSFTYVATDGTLTSGATAVTITVFPTPDPPSGIEHSYTTAEDTDLVVPAPGVLAGASDPDGDALTATVFAFPDHGTLTLTEDGAFTYTPDSNFNGADSFLYRVSDGALFSDPIAVSITVTPVADPPQAADDAYTVAVGATLTVASPGVLANDFDDTGAGLTAQLGTDVTHGTLTLNADGSFTYTTDLTAAGADSFTYTASDGTLTSNEATVTITITSGGGGGGQPGSFGGFTTPTLSVYDFDNLNTHVGGAISRAPTHGKLVLRAGTWYYFPEVGYRGRDTFTVGGRAFTVDVLSYLWGDY